MSEPAGACGWVGKILEVDLSTWHISTRETSDYVDEYLGGRALAARLGWEFLGGRPGQPAVGAFDEANPIIIATGPLCGTLAPTSGRTIMAAVSPRTQPFPWYTHSTIGGWFGPELKYAGYDAVILRGRSPSPAYLRIEDGRARIENAAALWGKGARDTTIALKQRYGQRSQVLAIGQAGEHLSAYATVQHAEENAAGHSGFGAVWGSKNLKAIVVRGTGSVGVADPAALIREARGVGGEQLAPNAHAFAVLRHAPRGVGEKGPICSAACRFNCIVSTWQPAGHGRLVPAVCMGFVWWHHGDLSLYEGDGLRVPAGVDFPDDVSARQHAMCNDFGLDLWLRTAVQPWLLRAQELGLKAVHGYPIHPEDPAWFTELVRQLAFRQGLGALLADGMLPFIERVEGEVPAELTALARHLDFGFGFSAHREGRLWDEEPLPFWVISAMMYVSETRDPTIGTHNALMLLADAMVEDRELARRQFRKLSEQVWGDPEALESSFEGKIPLTIWAQHQHVVIDSLPLCDFAFPQTLRPVPDWDEFATSDDLGGDLDIDLRLLRAVTGRVYTRADLDRIAERTLNLERMLLARAGRERKLEETLAWHFKLPCRADGTSIDSTGFSRLVSDYFAARGWDQEKGWPLPETLERLGLSELVVSSG